MPEIRITRRIVASGEWEALSALHVGGERDAPGTNADMTLLRTASGEFYIPGSSLAGAARSALAAHYAESYARFRRRRRADEDSPEEKIVCAMFGEKYASLLTFEDAHASDFKSPVVRDGVRIDAATGLARDGAKFNFEVLPAGARFVLKLTLTLYDQLPLGVTEVEVLAAFRVILDGFLEGRIRLGARTRRGLGQGSVRSWQVYELDWSNPAHLLGWLHRNAERGRPMRLDELGTRTDPRAIRWFHIEAALRLRTSLLVRSVSERPGDPDTVHLTENGRSLLCGSSLAGALRHRVERIANTLGVENGGKIVQNLFGPLHSPEDGKIDLRGSRLWVSDAVLSDGARHVQGRVAIDRFTGGARDSALFDEAPFWPDESAASHMKIQIRIEEPRDCEIALLMLAFKDLWLGDLALGGETGGGRGVFEGVRAEIWETGQPLLRMQSPAGHPAKVQCTGDGAKRLEECVATIRQTAISYTENEWEEQYHAAR